MKHINRLGTWDKRLTEIKLAFIEQGGFVDTNHWQAKTDVPTTRTRELQNVVIERKIDPIINYWKGDMSMGGLLNIPWAEDHFLERVAGKPLNPGEQYKNWPWYQGNVEEHKEQGTFSHTYMERFWPKHARANDRDDTYIDGVTDQMGIRYRYGDLDDVVNLLAKYPGTRQAYLPIWFPEDTGAHHGERVPCSLGYHFMMRNGRLNVFYPMRSVDFYRYLTDDIYMAGRLVQWVLQKLFEQDDFVHDETDGTTFWENVVPGTVTLHAHSLHIFEGDLPRLKRELDEAK